MDIPRPNQARARRHARIRLAIGVTVVFIILVAGLVQLASNNGREEALTTRYSDFSIRKTERVNGYVAHIITDNAGNKWLTYRDIAIPLKDE